MRGVLGFEISVFVQVQESGYIRSYAETSGIGPQKNSKSVNQRGARTGELNSPRLELIAKD